MLPTASIPINVSMTKHHELPLGHCLGCLPVRLGVQLYSSFIFFLSICAVAGLVSEDTRVLVGGYTYWSRVTTDVLGCAGVVLSSMSIIGTQDNHPRWVKLFIYFAVIRVIARVFTFWADDAMLAKCSSLGITSLERYNPAMEAVKLSHRCGITAFWYTVISIFDILASLYGIYNAYLWCTYVENSPMYHIALDDTKPLRIYTGYSTVGHPEAPPTINVVPPNAPPQQMPASMTAGPPAAFGHPSMAYSTMHLTPPPSGYAGFGPPQTLPPSTLPPGTRAAIPM